MGVGAHERTAALKRLARADQRGDQGHEER
jgi:hypothetical protein